ncbi:TPA: hypothetical protein HA241_05055 [Candidatus Woesearchaeota archaeon]|nr:hypothetical protein [Candidatus Woesearchaeota archaeon]
MNAAPLDYLLLDPRERIDYRVARGITIKEWYESFRPEKPTTELMRYDEAREYLGIASSSSFYHLVERKFFGEPVTVRTQKFLSSENVYRVKLNDSTLVPLSSFRLLLQREQFYMSFDWFKPSFRKYFRRGIDGHQPGLSIVDTARVVDYLKRRKLVVEKWPTLEDYNHDTGLNLSISRLHSHIRGMVRRGEIRLTPISKDPRSGGRVPKLYKIEPHHYKLVVELERRQLKLLQSGVTTRQLAEAMGMSVDSVGERLYVGSQLGLLHPELITYNPLTRDARGGYVLSQYEASRLITGDISVPSLTAFERSKGIEKVKLSIVKTKSPLKIIDAGIERELWQRARAGQNDAFQILLAVYDDIICEEAARYRYGLREEDRRWFLPTALFEFIHRFEAHRYTTRDHVITFLREKLAEFARQERPSWISVNQRIGDGKSELGDLVDNDRRRW